MIYLPFFLFFIVSNATKFRCLESLEHLDIIVIQDVTNSSLVSSTQIRDNLLSLNNIRSINKQSRLGFGTFSDRPYVAPRSSVNGDHCLKIHSDLISTNFTNSVAKFQFSHTRAQEGGQLDALFAAATESHWPNKSLNVVILSTQSLFNQDGRNLTQGGDISDHDGCPKEDYPTVSPFL